MEQAWYAVIVRKDLIISILSNKSKKNFAKQSTVYQSPNEILLNYELVAH